MNGETINDAIEKAEAAKASAVNGSEFARDYKMVNGVKFYFATVAHTWIIPVLVESVGGEGAPFKSGLVALYALAHAPEDAASKLLQEMEERTLIANAIQFLSAHDITPEKINDLSTDLMTHPYKKK